MKVRHHVVLILISYIFVLGCSSQSILPEKDDVKVSRKPPSKGCTEIGPVSGRSISTKPNREAVLEDMKQDAANKGANYVVVKQYSDNGTAVTGIAYQCP